MEALISARLYFSDILEQWISAIILGINMVRDKMPNVKRLPGILASQKSNHYCYHWWLKLPTLKQAHAYSSSKPVKNVRSNKNISLIDVIL